MQFNNYNNATTNGAQLNNTQMGMSQVASGGAPMGQVGGAGISDVSVASPQVPQVGGAGGVQQGSGFFSPQGGAGLVLGGIQVLGNLWSSFQAHKMAKKQMSFAREQWDTNLENQTQTYNTALEDRVRGRYATGTRTEGELQGEIDQHSL